MRIITQPTRDQESAFLDIMHLKHQDVLNNLAAGNLTDNDSNVLAALAKDLCAKY